MIGRQALCLILLATGFLLISCSNETMTAPVASEPTSVPTSIDPATLYAANCAGCHGEKRHGMINLGGALTPEKLAAQSDTAIRDVISEGIPYTAMLAWKGRLSLEEIDAVVQFIKYTSP